jgi:hypothetical protein
LLHRRM